MSKGQGSVGRRGSWSQAGGVGAGAGSELEGFLRAWHW